jgi:hypothetical protein
MINILALLFTFAFAGPPPVSLKGQDGTKQIPKWNLQVPYNQATNLGGIDALIETDNGNFLSNGSFEGSTLGQGWTKDATVTYAQGTLIRHQNKSVKFTTSGAMVSGTTLLTQSVTPIQSLSGQNIEFTVLINSTAILVGTGNQGFKVCAMNGAVQVQCRDVLDADFNTWRSVTFTIAGPSSGSVGIALISTVSGVLGDIHVDGAYVGTPRNLGQFMVGGQFVGSLTASGCSFGGTTSLSYVTPTISGCTYTATGNVLAPTTMSYALRIQNQLQGHYMISASGLSARHDASSGVDVSWTDGTTVLGTSAVFTGTNIGQKNIGQSFAIGYTYTAPNAVRTYSLQIKNNAATGTSGLETVGGGPVVFNVYYFPDASLQAIRADQADYPPTSYVPTLNGFTATSTDCKHYRAAGNLGVNCKFTINAVSAAEMRVSFPGSLTSNPSMYAAGTNPVSFVLRNTSIAESYYTLVEPSVSYLTFGVQGAGSSAVAKANANGIFANGNTILFNAYPIFINGWISNQGAPQLANGRVTAYDGVEKSINADINCDASSSITNSSGGISVIGNRSGAGCALTINSGFFSASPWKCNLTVKSATPQATSCSCSSATSCTVYGPSADYDGYVSIEGPR